MPNTPIYGWPFQARPDAPHGPNLGELLAMAIEATVNAIDAIVTGHTTSIGLLQAPVLARLRQSASQSIPNITATPINFAVEDIDTHNGHDNVTNPSRYTLPVNGIYMISGNVSLAASSGGTARLGFFRKNGAIIDGSGVNAYPNASAPAEMALSATLVQGVAGDYIELGTFHNAGAALGTSVASHEMPTLMVALMKRT